MIPFEQICPVCHKTTAASTHVIHGSQRYHIECLNSLKICRVCNGPIVPNIQAVTASTGGEVWHTGCYTKEHGEKPKMSHSPEPWTTSEHSSGEARSIMDADGEIVATADRWDAGDVSNADDNFERIVACVNFCRQFDTEFLAARQLVKIKPEDKLMNRSLADIEGFDGLIAVTLIPLGVHWPGAPNGPVPPRGENIEVDADSGLQTWKKCGWRMYIQYRPAFGGHTPPSDWCTAGYPSARRAHSDALSHKLVRRKAL